MTHADRVGEGSAPLTAGEVAGGDAVERAYLWSEGSAQGPNWEGMTHDRHGRRGVRNRGGVYRKVGGRRGSIDHRGAEGENNEGELGEHGEEEIKRV